MIKLLAYNNYFAYIKYRIYWLKLIDLLTYPHFCADLKLAGWLAGWPSGLPRSAARPFGIPRPRYRENLDGSTALPQNLSLCYRATASFMALPRALRHHRVAMRSLGSPSLVFARWFSYSQLPGYALRRVPWEARVSYFLGVSLIPGCLATRRDAFPGQPESKNHARASAYWVLVCWSVIIKHVQVRIISCGLVCVYHLFAVYAVVNVGALRCWSVTFVYVVDLVQRVEIQRYEHSSER